MQPHRAVRSAGLVALRIGLSVLTVAVVAATGVSWWTVHRMLGGISVSQALGSDAPRSGGGAMNILLIGLDSRKDQNGDDLPPQVLDQLHAGDSQAGGYNTNTLILVHIAADDRVTAFSIPRDDYVAIHGIPGYTHAKIKEAYGLTKADIEQRLLDEGTTDQHQLETAGREAGRAATLAAVRDLTGAPIDYFAEVNLAGFYDVTAALGGVQVCLNHAVYDDYSGADFPAGRQTLDAGQALAFVRQRHGLDNGDLDRTHRQQAFLVSVMRQLQSAGSFTDMSKLNNLMAVVRKDLVLSAGWGVDQFRRIGAIAGANVRYQTLPVVRYDTVDGQDVNIVDRAAIKAQVRSAFGDDAASTSNESAPTSTVDVINAGATPGLAGAVSQALTRRAYPAGQIRNAAPGEPTASVIDYGTGAATDAQNLAALLAITASSRPDSTIAAGHVRVTLGADYAMPATLESDSPATTADGTSAMTSPPTDTPDQGRPIGGSAVPCVN